MTTNWQETMLPEGPTLRELTLLNGGHKEAQRGGLRDGSRGVAGICDDYAAVTGALHPDCPQHSQPAVSVHACGPSTATCQCRCPDGACEHVFDGPMATREEPGGGCVDSVTCSRCGMLAFDHDLWCGP